MALATEGERKELFMLEKLTKEKQMRHLCFLCCMAYFMSYMTRLNYAACMVELQDALGIGKDMAGLPVTMCFFSYGIGQLVFGFLGDTYIPWKMIFAGLVGSAGCNFLVAACPAMEVIIPAWCLNGVFQSMLWPPLVRTMAEMLSDRWYRQGCVAVSVSASMATVWIYLLTPLVIRAWGWKTVFVLPAGMGIAVACFWYSCMQRLGNIPSKIKGKVPGCSLAGTEGAGGRKLSYRGNRPWFVSLFTEAPLLFILFAIVLQGALKDGITTWMPVYMSEIFGMSNALSILSVAVLPVFGVICILGASFLLELLENEVFTAAVFFGAGTVGSVVMAIYNDGNVFVNIVMMILISGSMYSVHMLLTSRITGHFVGFGKVSTVSGILNATTYVGSAFSTYGFGAIAERAGWEAVIFLWVGIAFLGTIFLIAAKRKWRCFCMQQVKQ